MKKAEKQTTGKKAISNRKEKSEVLGYVNWQIGNVKSSRGFPIFDNQYLTKKEEALLKLAADNGGSVRVKAELFITVANNNDESIVFDDNVIIEKES